MIPPAAGSREPRGRRASHGAPIRPTPGFVPFAPEEIEQSIPRRFENQVEANRDRIAVKSRRFAVSYGALNQLANRVAHALLAGCGPESLPIALLLEKDAPYVAAILGILKAAKFYVPLDPSYPPATNQLIVDDAQAPVIITDDANLVTACRLGGRATSILNLDVLDPGLDDSSPRLEIPASAYACILYTSGSIGRPRGAVATHRNVLHNIKNFTNEAYITRNDRITGLNSFAFSGSLKDIFGSLLNGAALFPFEIERIGLQNLAQWLIAEEISIFTSVCTTFRCFASTLTGRELFPELRVIRIGSEAVTWKDVALFKAFFPSNCVLVNSYRTTETAMVRINVIDHETPACGGIVPVGYPVEGQEVLVLDEAGEPVDANQVGQIAVRSAYLSPGYWRQPDLTRKAFLPDPEGGDRRIYLTGDLGVLDPDGCLIHLGRKDFQVRVCGHRVETSEIETALREAPGVAKAVVMARSELHEDRCLVAYVVRARDTAGAPPSSRTLRDFLTGRLPEWSIPAAFVFLEFLPLTPTGKVDRDVLPAPDVGGIERTGEFIAPRTELEERLVAIWEDLMGVRPIGVADQFFDLGGNSLLGARLKDEIHRSLGRDLPLQTILSAPTIERLAEVLGSALGPRSRPRVNALKSSGSRPPFFGIPGSMGHPFSYYHLARQCDPEQPFFGLQYPEDIPEQPYPTRIEDLAARFLTEVRAIQPQGPYRLGGHSFGGVVAFELAQQLIALGQGVSLLVLFDTWGKGYPARRSLAGRMVGHLEHLRTLSFGERPAYLARKTLGVLHRRASSLVWAVVGRPAPPAITSSDIDTIHQTARRIYQPQIFPGRLVLIRAEQVPRWIGSSFDDPFLGWGGLASAGIEVSTVPGDHLTLLDRANVEALAQKLNPYLRDSATTGRGDGARP
jgi:amino acid adenylation domain-containing protein